MRRPGWFAHIKERYGGLPLHDMSEKTLKSGSKAASKCRPIFGAGLRQKMPFFLAKSCADSAMHTYQLGACAPGRHRSHNHSRFMRVVLCVEVLHVIVHHQPSPPMLPAGVGNTNPAVRNWEITVEQGKLYPL